MIKKEINIKVADILILGITFKENCPDVRNTKIYDVYKKLIEFGANVDVFDSVANKEEVKKELQIDLIADYTSKQYSAIILAVAHDAFTSIDFKRLKSDKTVIFDAKSFIDTKYIDGRL
jgi:UDP-N-acetyl-D-galactosamine dehydrogenase